MENHRRSASPYAPFWRRVAARAIDLGLILFICGLLYSLNKLLGRPIKYEALFDVRHPASLNMFMSYNFPGVALTYLSVKILLTYPYCAVMESSRLQGTIGKLATGITVTDLKGNRISFARATGRFFARFFPATLLMLGYVISFSDKKQAMHDFFARTLVIKNGHTLPENVFYRASPWLFDLPSFLMGSAGINRESYSCLFCHYTSDDKHSGCPKCKIAFAYGESGAIRGMQLLHGILFTAIGLVVLCIAAAVVHQIFIWHDVPIWVPVLILGFGGIFAAGGICAIFGRNWLVRMLILFFAPRGG